MDNYSILIEKYLLHTLTEEEKILVDNLLTTDTVFKKAFEEEQQLQVAIHLHNRTAIKNKLTKLEFHQPSLVKASLRKVFLSVAAILLVISLVVVFYFYSKPNIEKLYANYYATAPNIVAPIVRGGVSNTVNNMLQEAFLQYDQQNFAAAIPLFGLLTSNKQYQQIATFYTAICYMELKNYNQALQTLNSIVFAEQPYNFYYSAIWYKALCNLKLNNIEMAKQQFLLLSNTANTYTEQSKKILKAF